MRIKNFSTDIPALSNSLYHLVARKPIHPVNIKKTMRRFGSRSNKRVDPRRSVRGVPLRDLFSV